MLNKLREGHWPIFLLSSFSAIANLFLPIVLTRLLTPEDIGIYKIFFLYLGLLPFVFLTGGPLHSVYYWVGRKENRDSYLISAFQLTCILSLLIVLIGLPLSYVMTNSLGLSLDLVVLLIFSAALWVPSSFYKEYMIAMGATVWGSIFGTLIEMIKVVLFIGLAFYDFSLVTIFFSFLIYVALKFILTIFLLKREKFHFTIFDLSKIKEVFWYSAPIASAGLLTFLVEKMDQIVLTKYLATDDFAFYSMGCLIIPPLYMLEVSITKVLIPKLSEFQQNSKIALEYFRKAISDSGLLLIPASAGLFIFATPIVELLYTEAYTESSIYLKIFSFSYLVFLIPYDCVPRATGKTKWIFQMSAVLSPLSLIAVLLTASYSNAVNVLIVSIIFKALFRLAGLAYSCKVMDWNILEVIPIKKLGIFTISSIILSFLSLSLESSFESKIWWFFTCGTGFFLLYFVFLIYPLKKGYLSDI